MAKSANKGRNSSKVEDEIAQLRGLDLKELRARWKFVFRKLPAASLPKHLLFGTLAYQLQADAYGDLDASSRKTLRQAIGTRTEIAENLRTTDRQQSSTEPGTVLMREWKGRQHRVMALANGFAWNGKTFNSLSAVAFAMTGTRWNGPRFFGLRGAGK